MHWVGFRQLDFKYSKILVSFFMLSWYTLHRVLIIFKKVASSIISKHLLSHFFTDSLLSCIRCHSLNNYQFTLLILWKWQIIASFHHNVRGSYLARKSPKNTASSLECWSLALRFFKIWWTSSQPIFTLCLARFRILVELWLEKKDLSFTVCCNFLESFDLIH